MKGTSSLPWPGSISTGRRSSYTSPRGFDVRFRADILANRRFKRRDGAHAGFGLESRRQTARVGAVVLVHPKTRKARLAGDDSQLVGRVPAMDVLDEFVFFLVGRDDQRAARLRDGVDGLKTRTMPTIPRLCTGCRSTQMEMSTCFGSYCAATVSSSSSLSAM